MVALGRQFVNHTYESLFLCNSIAANRMKYVGYSGLSDDRIHHWTAVGIRYKEQESWAIGV
jgi:hypothetical protein